jgi:hypothetical protein
MRKTERHTFAWFLSGLLLVLPARCFAAADGDAPKTTGDTIKLDSASLPGESAASNNTAEAPRPHSSREDSRHIGAGLRLSTLGAGAEAAVSLTRRLNLRGGFNIFQYSRGFSHDGITYKGQLHLRSGEAHLDWYPLGYAFHVSPGLLLYNGNGATATANVPGGSSFTLGGVTYTSDPSNPISGTGKLDFIKVAPTAMVGFGNLVPPTSHFTFNFEVGAVFQGSARTKLNLAGNACLNGFSCVNAATDPTVQANIRAEQTKINNKLSPFQYYPAIAFGFGYRF